MTRVSAGCSVGGVAAGSCTTAGSGCLPSQSPQQLYRNSPRPRSKRQPLPMKAGRRTPRWPRSLCPKRPHRHRLRKVRSRSCPGCSPSGQRLCCCLSACSAAEAAGFVPTRPGPSASDRGIDRQRGRSASRAGRPTHPTFTPTPSRTQPDRHTACDQHPTPADTAVHLHPLPTSI
jgi:hypothetical protein